MQDGKLVSKTRQIKSALNWVFIFTSLIGTNQRHKHPDNLSIHTTNYYKK
jgi:hypothetical protein